MVETRSRKKQKFIDDAEKALNALSEFSDGVLFPTLQSFLSVNDTTSLSLTCKDFYDKILAQRKSSSPYIYFGEKRKPTEVKCWHSRSERRYVQFQTFMFQFHDLRNSPKTIVAEITLCNDGDHPGADDATTVLVKLRAPQRSYQNRNDRIGAFAQRMVYVGTENNQMLLGYGRYRPTGTTPAGRTLYETSDFAVRLFQNKAFKRVVLESDSLSHTVKADIRRNLNYVYQCLKRIPKYQTERFAYPSAEYMMHNVTKYFPLWLHTYLSEDFDRTLPVQDRVSQAPSPQTLERLKKIVSSERGNHHDFSLEEIPWFEYSWERELVR